jgi:uncharacterized protein YeaO (DUF488 family)
MSRHKGFLPSTLVGADKALALHAKPARTCERPVRWITVKTGNDMIRIKRVYETALARDGARFLVDHMWPRGLKKESVKIKSWNKAVSPSAELCKWFSHDPAKWKEFQKRYFSELDQKPQSWQPLLAEARERTITLVFSARDGEHNNALALKNYLEKRLKSGAQLHKCDALADA